MPVYIQSATQISAQAPLTDEWFETPVFHTEKRVQSNDPKFSDYLPPIMSRRMCSLLKRAIVTSRLTLQKAQVEMPDAIISGTGLGCIENTEKFLYSIWENEEQFLQPTYFMQSTHNIISSAIAVDLKCHGYNSTYVHRGASFENALLDAFIQFKRQRVKTVLVGGFDELTDDYYRFFDRIGVWRFTKPYRVSPKSTSFAAEAAVSMLLQTEKNEQTLCELNGVELMYHADVGHIRDAFHSLLDQAGCSMTDIDAIVTGLNSNLNNDMVYYMVNDQVFDKKWPLVQYQHLFGQSFSSSALGTYAAAICLQKQLIPGHMVVRSDEIISPVKRLLVYNHYKNRAHSLILLSRC